MILILLKITQKNVKAQRTNVALMRERKSIFRFPFSARVISFSFIDLNEDVWTVCMCVWFTPDGGCCLPPMSPYTP